MPETVTVELILNGQMVRAQVSPRMTLLLFLRDELHLTGTKNGCSSGHCGACTVTLNSKATRSCLVKMGSPRMAGARVETIEGLAPDGKLHPLQAAFIERGAIQCGFCIPGMLMAAKALLDENSQPTEVEIKAALTRNRNLCRCTGYVKIIEAIQNATVRLAAGERAVDPDTLLAGEQADAPRLRQEAIALATGAAQFSDDLVLEEMLYGKILWSAYPHAETLGIVTSEAETMEGVVLVVTARDIPGENRAGLLKLDQPAIAADKVRFISQRPVKITLTRTESLRTHPKRHPVRMRFKTGAAAEHPLYRARRLSIRCDRRLVAI